MTRPTIRREGGPGGFTLLETMAVLLVLGVVSAAAVPALDSVLGPDPDPARELAEVYRTARDAAASRGATVLVTVDPGSGSWALFDAAASGEALERGELTRTPTARGASGVPEPTIGRFHPSGRSRVPVVRLPDGPETRAVEVDPWTSSVRVR